MKTFKIASILFCIFLISIKGFSQQNLNFDKIRVSSNAHVNLIQGDTMSVVLDDDEDGERSNSDASHFYSINNDGWLVVHGNPSEEINVTLPAVSRIDISGSGKLESQGSFNLQNISLQITGVGKIEMNLTASKVDADISGAGKIELEGSADDLNIDISGSGKIDAENFKVKNCVANISGSGKCLLDVTDELTSNISGSGNIYYETSPAKVNNNISGSGSVGSVNVIEQDTTRIMLGKTKVLIIEDEHDIKMKFKDGFRSCDKIKGHWAGFELGVNLLMDDNFSNKAPLGYEFLDQRPEKSIAVHFNLVDFEIDLLQKNIMLITGIGFTINNYRFNSDAYLAPDSNVVTSIGSPAFSLSKNKLVNDYINVPLLIEFNTSMNPRRTFHFATGVIGGVRLQSHLKLIEDTGNNEVKHKIYDDFNVNPFRLDATVRLGYRNFTVFGSYGLNNFFKSDKDPELHAMTVGIRLVGW